MRSIKSCLDDKCSWQKAKFDGITIVWYAFTLLLFPAIVIVIIVTTGEVERQPTWDTGYLDDIDRELFKNAVEAKGNDSMPGKIAFLFLVRGRVPLETVWKRFFKGNDGMYSLYLHASTPGFNYDTSVNSSIFNGRQIPSVPIMWGGPNMIRAERRLLAAALADPANERFVLVSEACIPLHNFSHIHNYLFAANQSYVSSHVSSWRYKGGMHPLIRRTQFRKGSQWLAVTRAHALLVVKDTAFYEKFLSTRAEIPDESYIQTMLPILDEQHVVPRGVVYVHWRSSSSRHPDTFGAQDITAELIRGIQESRQPPVETVGFLKMSQSKLCTLNGRPAPCFLFARKFAPDSPTALGKLSDVLGY